MSKHTPEPWATEYRERHDGTFAQEIFDADGETIAILAWHPVRLDGWTKTDREENARRIVACVNACRGLPTDELEQKGLISAVGTELLELDKQSAELLAALEKLTGDITALMDESLGVYGLHKNGDPAPWGELVAGGRYEEWLLSISNAEELITKLKAGAA